MCSSRLEKKLACLCGHLNIQTTRSEPGILSAFQHACLQVDLPSREELSVLDLGIWHGLGNRAFFSVV